MHLNATVSLPGVETSLVCVCMFLFHRVLPAFPPQTHTHASSRINLLTGKVPEVAGAEGPLRLEGYAPRSASLVPAPLGASECLMLPQGGQSAVSRGPSSLQSPMF